MQQIRVLARSIGQGDRERFQVCLEHCRGVVIVDDPRIHKVDPLAADFRPERGLWDLEINIDILHVERAGISTNVTATRIARQARRRRTPDGLGFELRDHFEVFARDEVDVHSQALVNTVIVLIIGDYCGILIGIVRSSSSHKIHKIVRGHHTGTKQTAPLDFQSKRRHRHSQHRQTNYRHDEKPSHLSPPQKLSVLCCKPTY